MQIIFSKNFIFHFEKMQILVPYRRAGSKVSMATATNVNAQASQPHIYMRSGVARTSS